jgi:hypothetical protein
LNRCYSGYWLSEIQEPHPQPPPPSGSPVAYGGKPAYSAGSPQARRGLRGCLKSIR